MSRSKPQVVPWCRSGPVGRCNAYRSAGPRLGSFRASGRNTAGNGVTSGYGYLTCHPGRHRNPGGRGGRYARDHLTNRDGIRCGQSARNCGDFHGDSGLVSCGDPCVDMDGDTSGRRNGFGSSGDDARANCDWNHDARADCNRPISPNCAYWDAGSARWAIGWGITSAEASGGSRWNSAVTRWCEHALHKSVCGPQSHLWPDIARRCTLLGFKLCRPDWRWQHRRGHQYG